MIKYVILPHFNVSLLQKKKKKNIKIWNQKESSGILVSWDFKSQAT